LLLDNINCTGGTDLTIGGIKTLGSTLRLHYKKPVMTDRVIYTRPLFKIFNATSFTGFCIHKQMPHPPSFGMGHQSVYLVLWL